MQVALFIPCFNDTLFPNTGAATTRLLERLGPRDAQRTKESGEDGLSCGLKTSCSR
jgi:L-lactate dehydrogenase complex protein LldE